ncbi:MAG: hypothetical protein IID15_03525 [Candidatus Marinimicrobia bacterium]|nr:hypothetical protein [Candidatus Neomarinimicrobiota bacterium]
MPSKEPEDDANDPGLRIRREIAGEPEPTEADTAVRRRVIDQPVSVGRASSKGHGSLAQYVILQDLKILADNSLDHFCSKNSSLGCHPTRDIPGIEASTGSLGHGLALGIGMVLADKLRHNKSKVYVLISDGELQEGINGKTEAIGDGQPGRFSAEAVGVGEKEDRIVGGIVGDVDQIVRGNGGDNVSAIVVLIGKQAAGANIVVAHRPEAGVLIKGVVAQQRRVEHRQMVHRDVHHLVILKQF